MANNCFASYKIEDSSYNSFIRREIHNLAAQAGFSNHRTGEIDIVVAELTSNIVKHGEGGELLYFLNAESSNKFIELFAMDRGEGTNDIKRMLKDGVSSVNTLGHGLGAISRLSNIFQIYSQKGWGTVAYAKLCMETSAKPKKHRPDIALGAVQVCIPGEKLCGDGYHVKRIGDDTFIFLGDGLGHGAHAYDAVQTAISAFIKCEEKEPSRILQFIHEHVRKTRGLVASVVAYNSAEKKWRVCGVGNITTRIFEGVAGKTFMAHNGILGLNMPRTITDSVLDQDNQQNIIMYSDGLRSRWELLKFSSLFQYEPALIAGVLFKENARRNDDMTILVGKISL